MRKIFRNRFIPAPARHVAALLALLLAACSAGGNLRDLVQSGRYEQASALYNQQLARFTRERSRYTTDLGRLARGLNDQLEPDLKTSLRAVAAARWPAPRDTWQALRRHLADARTALDRYRAHRLLDLGNYRSPLATHLKVRLGILTAKLRRDAPSLFAAYPHFAAPRFFGVYPAPIEPRGFLDAHFGAIEKRLARARPDRLERFLALYPAGRDLSAEMAGALGNLHLRAGVRELAGSGTRVPFETFLRALGRSRAAGFTPDRRSGFELAFIHTYRPEGRRRALRFELKPELDLPVVGVRAAPYDAVRAAGRADYALIAKVAESRVERRIVARERIASRYRTGHRPAPNPAYERAVQTLQRAEARHKDLIVPAGLRPSSTDPAPQPKAQDVELEDAKNRAERAAAALRDLPRQIDVAITRDYAYERRTVAVEKHLRLVYYVIDRRTRTFSRGEISLKRARRFALVDGLHDDDADRAAALAGATSGEEIGAWETTPFPVRLSAIAAHFLERRGPITRLSNALAVRRALVRGG